VCSSDLPLATYREQKRGGKGRAGMKARDEDFISSVFVLNTHTPVLFFSSRGMVYKTQGLQTADRHAPSARQGAGQSAALARG